MNQGINFFNELTDKSVTNLKGLMYYMSDEGSWSTDMIGKCLELLEFKDVVMNSIVNSIFEKFGDKSL